MVVDKDVVLYHEEKGIVLITLNRPVVLNALNKDLLQQLSYLLDKVRTDNTVRVVIITGAGKKAFSAGADIKFLNQATSYEIRELAQLSVNNKIETLGKVVVAAINGYALGGGLELAEACAFSIADSHAIFGHPEVYIRAIAGWGGTTRLPRLVGKGRATELLLTGNQISAENALQIGLVNRIVETEKLLHEAEKFVLEILSQSPIAVKMTLEAIVSISCKI